MSVLKIQGNAQMINSDLNFIIKEIHLPKTNLSINEKAIKEVKDVYAAALDRQKNNIKYYENDQKRYKVLKKYGEVLQKVETLLGLIPSDLSKLSLEDLEEKLKELMKTRKKNEMQISFMFYQNLITDLMTNLLTIEKDFQEGKISAKQAYDCVQTSKIQIADHAADAPAILRPAVEEASYLVKLYENSYSTMHVKQTTFGGPSLKETDIELKHEYMFDNLNNKTKDIIAQVKDLSTDMSRFEPHVDLTDLTKQLKDADQILETTNFDVDRMNSAVADLERTTTNLTSKQIDLNNQNEALSSRINDCSIKIKETSKMSMQEFSRETFKNMSERATTNKETTEEVKELIEDEHKTPTSIGAQTANTILSQIDSDKSFGSRLALDPNADTTSLQKHNIENAEDVATLLNEEVLTLEEKRKLMLMLQLEKEDENPEGTK